MPFGSWDKDGKFIPVVRKPVELPPKRIVSSEENAAEAAHNERVDAIKKIAPEFFAGGNPTEVSATQMAAVKLIVPELFDEGKVVPSANELTSGVKVAPRSSGRER